MYVYIFVYIFIYIYMREALKSSSFPTRSRNMPMVSRSVMEDSITSGSLHMVSTPVRFMTVLVLRFVNSFFPALSVTATIKSIKIDLRSETSLSSHLSRYIYICIYIYIYRVKNWNWNWN